MIRITAAVAVVAMTGATLTAHHGTSITYFVDKSITLEGVVTEFVYGYPHPQVYFVHSYYCEPTDPGVIIARSTYGATFAAAAARDSVAGVQFHPEKSQGAGLGILRNFLTLQSSAPV